MHRVELKEHCIINKQNLFSIVFLMHRVELKVRRKKFLWSWTDVPNAPCGVERHGLINTV